jgi:DNA repair ATPase RecN
VVELSEIARSLSAYAEKLDLDPEQLAALEQRVSLFETLKRKYGGSIAEVIGFGERAAERMRKIEGRDAELERLTKDIENIRAQMNRAGETLRKLRAKAAPKLSENIRRNLRDLGFRQWNLKQNSVRSMSRTQTGSIRPNYCSRQIRANRSNRCARDCIQRRNLTADARNQVCASGA